MNSKAFSLSILNGSILSSYVEIISFILTKFSSVLANFFSASSFLFLNFTIPAASSINDLLSSGLPLNIASIFPCPINEYPSFPIPVSVNKLFMSFNLHFELLIKYSDSPDLNILLDTVPHYILLKAHHRYYLM